MFIQEDLCYFPAPRGSWPETSSGFFLGELSNEVSVVIGRRVKRVYVEIPAEFIRFYYNVLRPCPPKEWFNVHFKVERSEDKKRWYFFYVYAEKLNGDEYAFPLWYWTPANRPKWLR